MNTIVNITGLTLKCLGASDENVTRKQKMKENSRKWYLKNREKHLQRTKEWYLKNKEKHQKLSKEWYLKNKDLKKQISKEWYLKNKKRRIKISKEWYLKNKEKHQKLSKEWSLKNKEKHKNLIKKWYLKNKEYIREKNKERRKTDSAYKLLLNLRRRTSLALKGKDKSANTMALLGITNIEFLWKHLESTFKPGMTRENHGKWHIDHIRPCASFDLSNPEEQIKCFHYTNLQALWAHENISKGAKFGVNPQ